MYGVAIKHTGIAIDDEGYSLVSEDYNVDNVGCCIHGSKVHAATNPHGTALDPRDGSVYVADYVAKTVLKHCV